MLGPSLHALQHEAKAAQLDQAYTARLLSVAETLNKSRVPTIFSLMHLAHLSNTSWTSLRHIITRENDSYSVFEIKKRSGGNRRICAPVPMLKRVQRWIHENILLSPGALNYVHHASTAYAPGSAIVKNAQAHAGCAWLIKVDIKDFFESISERQVYHVFRSLGYPALLSFELARLCTRLVPKRSDGTLRPREKLWRWTNGRKSGNFSYASKSHIGHLPQGAPTSAMLANLVVGNMDKKIQKIADECGASFTRYADDIVLSLTTGSQSHCHKILKSIVDVVSQEGYRVNRVKTHVSGPGARKIVTGLVVNDKVPRLTRAIKDEIELALYHIKKHGLLSHAERHHSNNPLGYLNHLTGLIYFAKSVEHDFGSWAMSELNIVLQPHSDLLQVLRTLASTQTDLPYYFS